MHKNKFLLKKTVSSVKQFKHNIIKVNTTKSNKQDIVNIAFHNTRIPSFKLYLNIVLNVKQNEELGEGIHTQ